MYDKTQEPNEFIGDSVDDATASAARFFGVESGDLKVVVAEDGLISGAAGRTVVVAYPKSVTPGRPRGGGDDEGRGRGRDREPRERGGRERGGRGRRDREGGRDGGGRGREGRESRRDSSEAETSAGPEATPEESKGTAKGELGAVGGFVLGVVERMVVGAFEIAETAEDDLLVYQISGDATERLSGGDGRAVDALQVLANQASKQLLDDAPRIVIDVEGEMADREDSLQRLATRAAGRAVDTGRAVALDPMNSRDRRIIHVALRDEDKIATMSIGTGRYRQVVVVPEGAPEYDEAIQTSQQANS